MKHKRTDLKRLLHVLDSMKIEYAKAQMEVTEKGTGIVRHLTVIQNGFVFDRFTGKYCGTHWGNLLKPEGKPLPSVPETGRTITQSEIDAA